VSAELQNSIAMCGTFVGTFKYMSPERMRSEKYSYASDMWSLGLVLMECATGQYPYVQDNSAIEMVQVSSSSAHGSSSGSSSSDCER
jgi:mitogen-activated protein kinase kinase 3